MRSHRKWKKKITEDEVSQWNTWLKTKQNNAGGWKAGLSHTLAVQYRDSQGANNTIGFWPSSWISTTLKPFLWPCFFSFSVLPSLSGSSSFSPSHWPELPSSLYGILNLIIKSTSSLKSCPLSLPHAFILSTTFTILLLASDSDIPDTVFLDFF